MVLESLRLQVLSSSVAQALVVVWREATSLQLVKPNYHKQPDYSPVAGNLSLVPRNKSMCQQRRLEEASKPRRSVKRKLVKPNYESLQHNHHMAEFGATLSALFQVG